MTYGTHRLTQWTEARTKAFIISTLRAGSRRWPPKFETLKEAHTGKKVNKKTNRLGNHYKCNACKGEFPSAEVQVDHINPVVDPQTGFVDWNTYVERMFCGKDNLQVLCKSCHTIKTNQEKQQSKSVKPSKPKTVKSNSRAKSARKN